MPVEASDEAIQNGQFVELTSPLLTEIKSEWFRPFATPTRCLIEDPSLLLQHRKLDSQVHPRYVAGDCTSLLVHCGTEILF